MWYLCTMYVYEMSKSLKVYAQKWADKFHLGSDGILLKLTEAPYTSTSFKLSSGEPRKLDDKQ